MIPSCKEVTLEIERVSAQHWIDLTSLDLSHDWRAVVNEKAKQLIFQLDAFIACDRFEVYDGVPATWWDHFKRDFLPKWLSRLVGWNVRKKVFHIRALYPQLKLPPDRFPPRIQIHPKVDEDSDGWRDA